MNLTVVPDRVFHNTCYFLSGVQSASFESELISDEWVAAKSLWKILSILDENLKVHVFLSNELLWLVNQQVFRN